MASLPEMKIGISFPGESLAVAFVNAWSTARQTMSQENRDRADKLLLDSIEQGNTFWRLLFTPLLKALERAAEKPE